MAQLIDRVRTVVRSLGNRGAIANVEADMAVAADARAAVDQVVARLAVVETSHLPDAA